MNRVICLMLLMLGHVLVAQNDTQQLIAKHRYDLVLENNVLKGNGSDVLTKEALSSDYFLIGEDHGLAEIPQFAAALFKRIAPFGYKNFGVEIGPITALELDDHLKMGKPEAFVNEHDWAVPFFWWEEELKMLKDIFPYLQTGVWGVDQEFILSPRLLLNKLLSIADTKEKKDAVNGFLRKEIKAVDNMINQGNYLDLLLVSSIESDFQKLEDTFRTDAKAMDILGELRHSWEIYQASFNRNGSKSNQLRAALMIDHLKAYQDNAPDKRSKTMIKLGAMHTYSSGSLTNVNEIGHYISDQMIAEGKESFHLMVMGISGTFNNYLPQNGLKEAQKKTSYKGEKRALFDASLFFDLARSSPSWSLFDLRPIKDKLKKTDTRTSRFLEGYDALLLIPQVSAASSMH